MQLVLLAYDLTVVLYRGFSRLADIRFLEFQPEFLHQYIKWQRFDYSAVVFSRAHLHTTLGILLKYNNHAGKLVDNENAIVAS